MDDNYFFCSFSCSVRGPLGWIELWLEFIEYQKFDWMD